MLGFGVIHGSKFYLNKGKKIVLGTEMGATRNKILEY